MDDSSPRSLADIHDLHIGTYESNADRIESDAGTERQDRADYEGRFIFELLQNAVDEMDTTAEPRVKLRLTEDRLLVANNGAPFSFEDLYAMTLTTRTTKAGETTIGHKGRGFTAVLGITDNPRVFSADVQAQFDRTQTASTLNEVLPVSDALGSQLAPSQVPLLCLPHEASASTDVQQLLDEGFTTVFELPLREPDRHRESIQRKLKSLEANTVALLPELVTIEIECPALDREWTISRTEMAVDDTPTLIRLTRSTEGPDTDETTTHRYCLFERTDIDEKQIASAADLTQPEIDAMGELRVGIAFVAEPATEDPGPRMSDWQLKPVYGESRDRPPYLHVFLPTQERSPIPALITGTFQSDTSRRNLTLDYDEQLGYDGQFNGYLFDAVGKLLADAVVPFVSDSATDSTDLVDALDPSLGQAREWSFTPGSVDHCLFERVKDNIRAVPFLPSPFTNTHLAIADVCLPPTADEIPGLSERFVRLLETGRTIPDSIGDVPAARFLTYQRAATLEAYEANRLSVVDVPAVLSTAEVAPVLRTTTERECGLSVPEDTKECTLHIDPLLAYLVQLKRVLEGDEARSEFDTACRQNPVFPIGVTTGPMGDQRCKRRANPDGTIFMPPESNISGGSLPTIEFLPTELYHGTNPDRAKQLRVKALPADFSSDLQSIWDIKPYQFTQVFDTAIRPHIPGPNSPDADSSLLERPAVLKTIKRMADVGSPENERSPDAPLLYQSSRKPFAELTKLPVPTTNSHGEDVIEWYPANRVYFSSAWQSALGRQEDAYIEPLLNAVEEETDANRFAPKFLAPPEWFDIDTTDEDDSPSDELNAWTAFFKWLGVSEHIRPLPLFAPDAGTRHRYKETEGLSRPPRSTISEPSELAAAHSDTPVDHRYIGLPEEDWQAYRTHLKEHVDPEIPESDQQYLYQVNSLEYADEILASARANQDVGVRLLRHLVRWWDSGLAAYRHAHVAEFTNQRWRGSNASHVFYSNERERLGWNLWVWQLRQEAWVPTTFGAVAPTVAWSLPAADRERFSLELDRDRPLLPFISAGFPTRETETPISLSSLAATLGIGLRLEQESFSSQDAYHVVNRIGELLAQTTTDLSQFSSAVELLYTRVTELLPGLQQGATLPEKWQPEQSALAETRLLCRTGSAYQLTPAPEAYFVRSRSSRDRYGGLGVPLITLFKPEAASFGTYCGATDLRTAVKREPAYEDCPPLPVTVGAFTIEETWVENVLATLLLRLRTNRRSSSLVDQDTNRTKSFYDDLEFVENLDLKVSLVDGTWDSNLDPQPQGYYIERDGETVVRILIDRTLDREAFVDALTGAYTDRLDIPQYYEAVNNLIDHAFGESDPTDTLQARLRTVGSDVPAGQIQATRRELFDPTTEQTDQVTGEFDDPEPATPATDGEEETARRANTADTSNSASESGGAAHSSQVPSIEAVTKIGDRHVAEALRTDPTNTETDATTEMSTNRNTGGGGGGGTGHGTSQEYRTEIDAFGMDITMDAERSRLRANGESAPETKVFDIHTPELYGDARKDSTVLQQAITNFATQRGLSAAENPLNRNWPGFDVLTIRTDDNGDYVIDRCIELKTSGVNTRKPSLSWNEWKAAGGPLSEHYYLYVARNIRVGNSGDAELLEIPQPFERLHNRTREQRERNVQVDLRSFDFTDEPIIQQTIEWDE